MSGMENGMETVTLRVNRFTPRPERGRERGGSPFARKSSPFGDSGSTRRRPRGKQWVQDYVVPARPEDTVLDCRMPTIWVSSSSHRCPVSPCSVI